MVADMVMRMPSVRCAIAGLAITWLSSCAHGLHKRPHADDVEVASVPLVASGECDGAPLVDAASFFTGPLVLSDGRPKQGTVIAVDGAPQARMVCTLMGCNSECCNNGCGHSGGCTYVIAAGAENEICLGRDDFACGGTDCSGWCRPFSTHPSHRYRFVGEVVYVGVAEPKTSVPGVKLQVQKFCRLD